MLETDNDKRAEEVFGDMMSHLDWCELDLRGIIVTREPKLDELQDFIVPWKLVKESMPFIIGDWINIGDDRFGEKFSRALEIFGDYEVGTLMNYASTMRRVPFDYRSGATFAHHSAVASITDKKGVPDYPKMKELLDAAVVNSWTVGQIQAEVKKHKQELGLVPVDSPSTIFHKKAERVVELIDNLIEDIGEPEWKEMLIDAKDTVERVKAKYDLKVVKELQATKEQARKEAAQEQPKEEVAAEAVMSVLDPVEAKIISPARRQAWEGMP